MPVFGEVVVGERREVFDLEFFEDAFADEVVDVEECYVVGEWCADLLWGRRSVVFRIDGTVDLRSEESTIRMDIER